MPVKAEEEEGQRVQVIYVHVRTEKALGASAPLYFLLEGLFLTRLARSKR